MPRIKGTTSPMNTFLRAFRDNPAGPPPEQWPSPAILRRWLRRPAFQQALVSLRKVLQFRAEFHLAAAAANAAQTLHAANNPIPAQDSSSTQDSGPSTQDLPKHPADQKRLIDLLRLSHLRLRFPVEDQDFRVPSKYSEEGERLYTIDEIDDDFKPIHPFPGIGSKRHRTPFAAYEAAVAAANDAPQPPDLDPKNG